MKHPIRILLAGLASLTVSGCLDTNPGQAPAQAESARLSSVHPGHPACIDDPLLLVLDRDAIAPGRGGFSENDLGCSRKRVGNRATVDWFARNIGQEIELPAGSVGNEGWFAFTSVRVGWRGAGPDRDDGLRNYAEAGPGLGSPDGKGRAECLLDKVPGLAPLRATGLARLEGRAVCAIVLDEDVRMSYSPLSGDIRGANLGKVAFQVLSVGDAPRRSGTRLPGVRIRVLDADAVCGEPLAKFPEAPLPVSEWSPADAERPACAVQRTLLDEPWDFLDTAVWKPDDDVLVRNGLFQAQDGASSATADWIPACPLAPDTNSGVRFSNRLQLQGSAANDFVESGALFLVNASADGSFSDYAFLNVGFTGRPGKVFVELFGSSGGQDFDQFEESSVNSAAFVGTQLDLWIFKDSYQIAVGGEMVDTVKLAAPLEAVSLFEVGVQQIGGGLRGLVDRTQVRVQCKTEADIGHKCRRHSERRFCMRKGRLYCGPEGREEKRPGGPGNLAKGCFRERNRLIRMARERVARMAHPSKGLLCLARQKEMPEGD